MLSLPSIRPTLQLVKSKTVWKESSKKKKKWGWKLRARGEDRAEYWVSGDNQPQQRGTRYLYFILVYFLPAVVNFCFHPFFSKVFLFCFRDDVHNETVGFCFFSLFQLVKSGMKAEKKKRKVSR